MTSNKLYYIVFGYRSKLEVILILCSQVEDADDIPNVPSNITNESDVKEEKPAQQTTDNGTQEPSSVNIDAAKLPPHVVLEMPALSPTMVSKRPQFNVFISLITLVIVIIVLCFTESR